MSDKKIVDKKEIPSFMIINKYIIKGYRKNYNTIKDNVKSLFIKHNELLNVWSHLIGFLIFIGLFIHMFSWFKNLNFKKLHIPNIIEVENFIKNNFNSLKMNFYNKERILEIIDNIKENILFEENKIKKEFINKYDVIKNNMHEFKKHFYFNYFNYGFSFNQINFDKLLFKNNKLNKLSTYPIYLFIISAILCLGFSTVYHLFGNINQKIENILKRLDYAGISILIFGSTVPIYYVSFCNKNIYNFYLIISFISCLIVFLLFFIDKLNKEEYKTYKLFIYLSLSFIITIPMIHIGINSNFFNDQYSIPFFSGYHLFVFSGLLYILGLNIYIFNIPERFSPGKFDIWFSSHFIWHILVILGAFYHFLAVKKLFIIRNKLGCNF